MLDTLKCNLICKRSITSCDIPTARSARPKQSSDRTTLGSPLRAILKSNLIGIQPYE